MTVEQLTQKVEELENNLNMKINKLEVKYSEVFECEIRKKIIEELKIILNDKNLYILLNSNMFDDFTKDIENINIEIVKIKEELQNVQPQS